MQEKISSEEVLKWIKENYKETRIMEEIVDNALFFASAKYKLKLTGILKEEKEELIDWLLWLYVEKPKLKNGKECLEIRLEENE